MKVLSTKMVQVLETVYEVRDGHPDDADTKIKRLAQYWSGDGQLLAEVDITPAQEA